MIKKPRRSFYEWLVSQNFLRDDVVKFLFDHIRNIALGALVLGVALYWLKHPTNDPEWLSQSSILFLLLAGMLLFIVNFFHGLKKLGDAGVPSFGIAIIGIIVYIPAIGLFSQLLIRK